MSDLGGELDTLETNLTSLLNQVFGGLNSSNSAATAATTPAATKGHGHTRAALRHAVARPDAAGGQHEVLDLHLAPINLDLLGALIQTSDIYLNITASKGPGDLLGNLL